MLKQFGKIFHYPPKRLTLNSLPSVRTCDKPTIINGNVSPNHSTINFGATYTPTCREGYEISDGKDLLCQANGTLELPTPTCTSKFPAGLYFIVVLCE